MPFSSHPLTTIARFLAIAVLTLVGIAAPAQAQYGGTAGVVINPPVILPGGTIVVIGAGCNGGESVVGVIEVIDYPLGTVIADSQGDFTYSEMPINVEPGIYPVTFTCGSLVLTAELTVVDPDDAEAAQRAIDARRELDRRNGNLAFTGSNLATQLPRISAVLLGLGMVFIMAGRRSRPEPVPIDTAPTKPERNGRTTED